MGLDMYLEADRWVGGEYEHRKIRGTVSITMGEGDRETKIDLPMSQVSSITSRVGYWRKANAIHNWFVEHVQEGRDECQRSYVSREQLIELKALCLEALDNKDKAGNILPPTAGFFFGSTDIDEWYFNDLKDTVEIIDRCLAIEDDVSFYYQASW